MMSVKVKRVYETPKSQDGYRILVDRIWPRGVSKNRTKVDLWLKAVAPSTELRKWFGHDPEKWSAFKRRYFLELDKGPSGIEQLVERVGDEPVTLVFSARDLKHNQAVALKEYLDGIIEK